MLRLEDGRRAPGRPEHTLLVLRFDRGLSWEDTAAIMGIPSATRHKRYERLRARLRRELAG